MDIPHKSLFSNKRSEQDGPFHSWMCGTKETWEENGSDSVRSANKFFGTAQIRD